MKIDKETVYSKYNGRYAYCRERISFETMEFDRIVPKRNDGTDEIDNLNPARKPCNRWKITYTIKEFRNEISLQLERCNKYSRSYRMAKRYRLIEEKPQTVVFYFEKFL